MQIHLLKWAQNRALQVIMVVTLFCLSAPYLPQAVLAALYTASLLLKELLMWFLPVSVCVYIAATLAEFKKKAVFLLVILLLFEACSNALSIFYAYAVGIGIEDKLPTIAHADVEMSDLEPFFTLSGWRPGWWSADKGTIGGILLGLWCAFSPTKLTTLTALRSKVEYILTKVFGRLIPTFVLGFVAQMYVRNTLEHSLLQYGTMIGWVVLAVIGYLLFLFFLSAAGNLRQMMRHFWNLLPAGGMAFTSGCSLSTMPLTMLGVAKNLKNPPFARMIIPATTNIQQIGDCIVNALLCLMILKQFHQAWPNFTQWMQFLTVFVLARFTTAAVLGGAIFIMLPIYEKYLHFNTEMITLILAFNVVLDPIVTASNVMANGALCRVFERVWDKVNDIQEKWTELFKKKGTAIVSSTSSPNNA